MIFLIGVCAVVLGIVLFYLSMGAWAGWPTGWLIVPAIILFYGGIAAAVIGIALFYTGPVTIGN